MEFSAKRILFSGFTFWILLATVAMYMVYPLRKSIKMGIDLVGGTYITLEVQAEKAVESELIEKMQAITNKLKAAREPMPEKMQVINNMRLELQFNSPSDAQTAALFLRSNESDLEQSVEGTVINLSFSDLKAKRIMKEAVERNIEVLRTRVDKIGVSETPVFAQGDRNIVIELPDVKDPQEAKAIIGKAAVLEFKLVERQGSSEDDLLYEYDGELPSDLEILPGQLRSDGRPDSYYVVPKYTDITGRLLRDARPDLNQDNQMVVTFEWSPEGGDKFHDLTSKNYRRNLAVVLDGTVIQAPSISGAIRHSGYISGGFTPQKAKELALLLKSGSFVAPVTFEEERQVGPSLGAESIKRGLISCLAGLGLIFLFSLYYYNLSGLFAFLALVYNLLLVLFGLGRLGATLTLPGIAGLVLTIGMAIDASILIFERIKEELASGADVRRAVNQGFSHAMSVILDGNITTFIIGAVLYKFGTGPIQGFAVTMMIGIIATLITSLFFLRSLFMLLLNNMRIQKLRI
jgi:preprotein translocase subunit SecD